MITLLSPYTIIIGTVAGFLVGFLWYSKALFLQAFVRGEGLTIRTLPKRSTYELSMITFYSLLAHGVIASVLAIMFDLLSITRLSIALPLALLLTFGLVVTTRFMDMVYTTHGKHYDAQHQLKFLVGSGYYLTSVSLMTIAMMLFVFH